MDILDQECSQNVLQSLAKHCVEWKLIGFHLELTKVDIATVGKEYQTAEQKQIGMLEKWKEKLASNATYRTFIEALLSCEKASEAIEACRAIVSSKFTVTRFSIKSLVFVLCMCQQCIVYHLISCLQLWKCQLIMRNG